MSEPIFTHDEFLKTQLDVLQSFHKKLNSLFIESVASQKKPTRKVLLELMGILRETLNWYIKINSSMLAQNRANKKTKKINLN